MDCPYCGSPVMIRGNYWECGYCGDSGMLPANEITFDDSECEVSFSVSASFVIDLEETWRNMKKTLNAFISPGDMAAVRSMARTVIYEISRALSLSHRRLPREKQTALNAFLRSACEFRELSAVEKITEAAATGRTLYESEGKLSENDVGEFWENLIAITQGEDVPDLDGIFSSLGDLYQYFVSEKLDMSSCEREGNLRTAFEHQWYKKRLFAPDTAAAEARLCQDDLSNIDSDLRDILAKNFPALFKKCSADDMRYFYLSEFFETLKAEDGRRAPGIWTWLQDYLVSISAAGKNITDYLNRINPFPRKADRKPQESESLREKACFKVRADDSKELYRYVRVQVSPGNRVYSYRTDDDTLAAGDRVLVPFGLSNRPTPGTILEVGLYTAENAPYPPEKTKFVISRDNRIIL